MLTCPRRVNCKLAVSIIISRVAMPFFPSMNDKITGQTFLQTNLKYLLGIASWASLRHLQCICWHKKRFVAFPWCKGKIDEPAISKALLNFAFSIFVLWTKKVCLNTRVWLKINYLNLWFLTCRNAQKKCSFLPMLPFFAGSRCFTVDIVARSTTLIVPIMQRHNDKWYISLTIHCLLVFEL